MRASHPVGDRAVSWGTVITKCEGTTELQTGHEADSLGVLLMVVNET
jgi:hypothetical protein